MASPSPRRGRRHSQEGLGMHLYMLAPYQIGLGTVVQ